ncbi:MAG TPA: hypothetical protein VL501_02765 [Pyrinomonadaceae bacterium]|nr:hypothetical protein [Pyrinomonadaceae bacterium]
MSRFYSPLDNVHVASPCSADWDSMYGDDRKRFCKECKLNVFNLSGMTREDAERLITNAQGRLCVRFYKRPDGTIITQDCPVGWARIKQRTRIYATAALSMLAAMLTGIFFVSLFKKQPVRPTMGDLIPVATPTPVEHTMGAVAIQGNFAVTPPRKTPDANFEMGKARVLAGDRD